MKRALFSFVLFFAVQVLAALAAAGYMFATGRDVADGSDEFIVAAGVVLLVGNFVLAFVLYYFARHDTRPAGKTGLLRASAIAAASLLLLALGETLVFTPIGLEDPETERLFIVMAASPLCLLNLCIVGPIVEEFVFRWGVLGGLLGRGTKPWIAILVSALCFSAVHGNLLQAPPAFISGVLLGIIYIRTKSLVPCIAAHIINNTLAVFLMFCPDLEKTLTAQPASLLVAEGLALAVLAFFVVYKGFTHSPYPKGEVRML